MNNLRRWMRLVETETVKDRLWYHGTDKQVQFQPDRPAFFAANLHDSLGFVSRSGVVLEARLDVRQPIGEDRLLKIGIELGIVKNAGELFSADYNDFPDVSSFIGHANVRRHLDQLGFDCYWGTDGYFEAVALWNPALIHILRTIPVAEIEQG